MDEQEEGPIAVVEMDRGCAAAGFDDNGRSVNQSSKERLGLGDVLHAWVRRASDLASTPEFSSLVDGTIDVAKAATGTAVHVAGTVLDASVRVALLPVTLPVAVASVAVSTVVSVACVATDAAGGVVRGVVDALLSRGGGRSQGKLEYVEADGAEEVAVRDGSVAVSGKLRFRAVSPIWEEGERIYEISRRAANDNDGDTLPLSIVASEINDGSSDAIAHASVAAEHKYVVAATIAAAGINGTKGKIPECAAAEGSSKVNGAIGNAGDLPAPATAFPEKDPLRDDVPATIPALDADTHRRAGGETVSFECCNACPTIKQEGVSDDDGSVFETIGEIAALSPLRTGHFSDDERSDQADCSAALEKDGEDAHSPTTATEAEKSRSFFMNVGDLDFGDHTDDERLDNLLNQSEGVAVVRSGAQHASSVRRVTDALVDRALLLALDDCERANNGVSQQQMRLPRWSPEGDTHNLLRKYAADRSSGAWLSALGSNNVLKWSGLFPKRSSSWSTFSNGDEHERNPGGYEFCDALLIKTCALVDMSPLSLRDLLLDAERVREFSRNSLWKKDLHVFSSCEAGNCEVAVDEDVTKIVIGAVTVPIVGTVIRTKTLTHARRLDYHRRRRRTRRSNSVGVPGAGDAAAGGGFTIDDGDINDAGGNGIEGHVIVSRSVSGGTDGDDNSNEGGRNSASTESEVVWNVTLLRSVPNEPLKTDLTTIAQLKTSPSAAAVPGFIVKRIGLSGTTDFVTNLRSLCR